MSGWSVDQVASWARLQGLDEDSVKVLQTQKVRGKGLLTLTYGMNYVKIHYYIAFL